MTDLANEKTHQALGILREKGLDLWLTFVRETSATPDPILPLIYGESGLTWHSALILARTGERIAIVGAFEADAARQTGAYDAVIPYHESIGPALVETLHRLNPGQIGVNTSRSDPLADGLTCGMRQVLEDLLAGTPYADRLVPAQEVISALAGRKTPAEVARIRAAVAATAEIFSETFLFARPGKSEREIWAFMQARTRELGLDFAWSPEGCPIVNAGPESVVGHTAPGENLLAPGQILHLDFGVRKDGYCSDIQRVAYVLRPGETSAPEAVSLGFAAVRDAICQAMAALRPGATGLSVDAAARQAITAEGYPEYKYATGHQLGRRAHDGGGLLGPAWERYGDTPYWLIEAGQVYTIEPGLSLDGYGYVGLEEDVLVTENGAEYLGDPQEDLILI